MDDAEVVVGVGVLGIELGGTGQKLECHIASADLMGDPQWVPLNSATVRIPVNSEVRIAGSSTVYHAASTYDSLPTGGPKKLHGIAVSGGAIWLPTDGTVPYFSQVTEVLRDLGQKNAPSFQGTDDEFPVVK